MYYNLTNISSNQTTILSFTKGVNTILMHDMLGIMILLGLWFVVFTSVMASSNDGVKASLTAGFITFSLALSLVAIGLAPGAALFFPLVATAITVALSWGK